MEGGTTTGSACSCADGCGESTPLALESSPAAKLMSRLVAVAVSLFHYLQQGHASFLSFFLLLLCFAFSLSTPPRLAVLQEQS